MGNKKEKYISKEVLIKQYGWTEKLIEDFLSSHSRSSFPLSLIEETMETEEFKKRFEKIQRRRQRKYEEKRRIQEEKRRKKREREEKNRAKEFLCQFDIGKMIEQGRMIERKFVIHVGPTNSGKTYHALQALKAAKSGVYLGPLRLLALEMFDSLNNDGFPCNLLTGEEKEDVPDAGLTASTIEMCNYNKHYNVAIIDEAQLIFDTARGGNWTKAILLLDASVIHVCVAPEGLKAICALVDAMGCEKEIIKHERLAPLKFKGLMRKITDVQRGDALITFSRKGVLGIAAELENNGIKASVIYGALPPASRREEVRRFISGETTVVVATDAIGLGVSLPIHRIIFCATNKFDGTGTRQLKPEEIKQIAGRAGRFGIYDEGYVLTFNNDRLIRSALEVDAGLDEEIVLPFPEDTVYSEFDMLQLFRCWNELPKVPGIERVDMSEAAFLYRSLPSIPENISKAEIYSYVCCPVDTKSDELVGYWRACCMAIFSNESLPRPTFSTDTLEGCELQYKALDVRHQLLRRIGVEDDSSEERISLCEKINEFLKESKLDFLRKCSVCGKPLPTGYPYGMCHECYDRRCISYHW